jgi:hypothetical protein
MSTDFTPVKDLTNRLKEYKSIEENIKTNNIVSDIIKWKNFYLNYYKEYVELIIALKTIVNDFDELSFNKYIQTLSGRIYATFGNQTDINQPHFELHPLGSEYHCYNATIKEEYELWKILIRESHSFIKELLEFARNLIDNQDKRFRLSYEQLKKLNN